jgi:DNA-binding transcriptional LysR family regulator
MTLNQLRAFVAAVRLGSFTAAAAELKMAQASISELVRRLEEEFDMQLFVRGPRRLSLTNAGTELLPYAEQALAAVDGASNALRSRNSLAGGTVSFGVLRNWEYYGLAELPREFNRDFPSIKLRLVGLSSTEVAAGVANGDLEAGIVVLPVEDDGLIVTPLIRDELVYATSDDQPTGPMTVSQLAEANLTLYDAHSPWSAPTRKQLAELAQREGVKLQPRIEVEHVDAALRLVGQGYGSTVVPRAIANSTACPPGIRTVSFVTPLFDAIAFVQRPSTALSPGAVEFSKRAVRMLVQHAASDDRLHPGRFGREFYRPKGSY